MRWYLLAAIAVAAACGSLPDQGDGIVALEVTLPDSLCLSIGQPLQLHALARNLQGDPVTAAIFWYTPDTSLVTLDTVTGVTEAKVAPGIARIQARSGTLVSNTLSFTLRSAPACPQQGT